MRCAWETMVFRAKYLKYRFGWPQRALLKFAIVLLVAVVTTLPSLVAQTSPGLRSDAILDHLNAVINWYRGAMSRVPSVGLPSDAVYQMNAQNLAAQVAQLAFQSAEAEGTLIPASSPASAANAADPPSRTWPRC